MRLFASIVGDRITTSDAGEFTEKIHTRSLDRVIGKNGGSGGGKTAMGEDQYAKRKQGWACSALSCGRPSRRLSDRAPNGIAAGRRVGRLSRSSDRAR
jgi:hypothetical protein